jgi:hypothetical protein
MKNQSQHSTNNNFSGFAITPGNSVVVIHPIITPAIFSVIIGISVIISLLSIIILG